MYHQRMPTKPDIEQWTDPATGLECFVFGSVLGPSIFHGFVGVPGGHPAYGKPHHAVDVLVHGGLRSGSPWVRSPDEVWAFGFTCPDGFEYAQQECRDLAAQLNQMKGI